MTPTVLIDAVVTQGIGSNQRAGTLHIALTGGAVTTITVSAAPSVSFDAVTDLIVGGVTIVHADLTAAISSSVTSGGNVLRLAQPFSMKTTSTFNGIAYDGHNKIEMKRITTRLPGLFDVVQGSHQITYNDGRLRTRMNRDGSIKIGDEIFSSFNVSKHSPLGILVVKVFAYQGWRWLVTNDTDVRNGYVQHVRCRANGGWFTLSFAGVKSAKIQWDATILELDTILKDILPAVSLSVTAEHTSSVYFNGLTATPTSRVCDPNMETVLRIDFQHVPSIHETVPIFVAYGAKLTNENQRFQKSI